MDATTIDTDRMRCRFHALSDATRLRIVTLLAEGERCVCELQAALDAAQSRLSYHLKTLKEAGLVSVRCDGRWSYYALRTESLDAMAAFLEDVGPADRAPDPIGAVCAGGEEAGTVDCC